MMTKHQTLSRWVDEMAQMTKPDRVVWVDDSPEENERLLRQMVAAGMATPLNSRKRPGCYLFRSDASDVARVENRMHGPTNVR